jgi:hypothetical protein
MTLWRVFLVGRRLLMAAEGLEMTADDVASRASQ